MNSNTHQQAIYDKYSSLLHLLNEAHDSIDSLKPANDDIKKYVSVFKSILMGSIENTKKRIEEVQTCMVWDHLVVAFFGSTNAGKSTIIETLRIKYESNKSDYDGEIVGTGKPDFTEKFDEYDLSIEGKRFTLIDMPGILSNEEKYLSQIQSALNKAHLVFYVDRDGTTPDVETVKKIQAYLQDWVKVYTIYNVSGFMVNRNSLLNNNVKESAFLIEKGYTNALGSCYAGNITLHAFFALASVANFPESRPDLISKRASSLKKFESCEAMYSYSEFSSFIDLILSQIANYKDEIVTANKQRLVAITTLTKQCLSDELKNKLQIQREIPIELKKFKNDICRYYDSAISDIQSSCYSIIKIHIDELNIECKKLVDKREKELDKKCDDLQNQTIDNISKELKKDVTRIIKQLSSKIKERKKKLDNFVPQFHVQASYNPGQARIDFQGAEACIKFDFENVMDILGDIAAGAGLGFGAGSLFPGAGNIIGAVVGGLGGLVKGLYDSFGGDSYKKQAKAAIDEAMIQLEEELQNKSKQSVDITVEKIKEQKDKNVSVIDKEIDKISQAVEIINSISNRLTDLEKEIVNK